MFWNPNTGMLWQFPCNCRRIYYWVLWLTLKNLAPRGFLNPHLINDCIFDILSLLHYCPYILLGFLQKEHEISISIKTHEPRNLDLFLAALYQKRPCHGRCTPQLLARSVLHLFSPILGLPSFIPKHIGIAWPDKNEMAKLHCNGLRLGLLGMGRWLICLGTGYTSMKIWAWLPRTHPCEEPGM